ncbi:MAG: hypothetical protein KKG59_07905 [Nanoarchaeota archaeon]|nr:hypothetical protein [Nanoarchaeota archaeon]
MEYVPLLSGAKWNLLVALSKKPQSPKDLAIKTNTSITNVLQQLSILDAHGIVDKQKDKARGPGKPKTIYNLKKELIHSSVLMNNSASKNVVMLKNQDMIHLLMLNQLGAGLFNNGEDAYYLTKFFLANEVLIRQSESIGYLQTKTDDIELLIIAENLQEIREQISNQIIKRPSGGEKKVVVWSHSQEEFKEGMHKKEKHFINFVKKVQTLYDPTGFFAILEK